MMSGKKSGEGVGLNNFKEAVFGGDGASNRPPTTEHRPPNTDHRPPNTEHRPPNTEHRTPSQPAKVWIGTSGYSFECWDGVFYPPRLPLAKRLEYYAGQFETLELNYTFYGMPMKKTSEKMVRCTPPGFRFFVKGNQNFTHRGCLDEAEEFLKGIRPFADAGRLDGLLFQFPQSFKNSRGNRDYLHRLVDRFQMHHLAIEFRDRSWDKEWIYRYLEDHRLSVVAVDEPGISTLFPKIPIATNDVGYVRLHSSNGDKWYEGKERYDYNYTEEELQEWAQMLGVIGERSRNIFVFFNNCHRGQAAQNAKEMKRVIEQAGLPLECATIDRSVTTIAGGLWEK